MGTKAGFAAGAVFALVVGTGTAFAATGGNFILGKANLAGATTTLSNGKGTALALKSRAGTPSLRVSNEVKVPNLNADKLDGMSASSFASANGRTGYVTGTGTWDDLDDDGLDDTIVATAQCPRGTMLTGGGSFDNTSDGYLYFDAPLGGGGWGAAVSVSPGQAVATDLEAYAVCYNPRGPVGGARSARMVVGGSSVDLESELLARLTDR